MLHKTGVLAQTPVDNPDAAARQTPEAWSASLGLRCPSRPWAQEQNATRSVPTRTSVTCGNHRGKSRCDHTSVACPAATTVHPPVSPGLNPRGPTPSCGSEQTGVPDTHSTWNGPKTLVSNVARGQSSRFINYTRPGQLAMA